MKYLWGLLKRDLARAGSISGITQQHGNSFLVQAKAAAQGVALRLLRREGSIFTLIVLPPSPQGSN